jgi:DNA invertase Pin-like site-specific DNA recombinase
LAFLCKLIDDLNSRGVDFKSLTDGIDTETSSGKLMFHMMGALAEFERDLISERTKEGMKAAKKRGVHIGRPHSLSLEEIESLWNLSCSGQTKVDLAVQFSVSINTVVRSLKRYSSIDGSNVLEDIV